MSREADQIYQWGYEEGWKIGYEEGLKIGYEERMMESKMKTNREIAISMAEFGMSIEQIVKVVKEDAELVRKWIAEEDGSDKMNATWDEILPFF